METYPISSVLRQRSFYLGMFALLLCPNVLGKDTSLPGQQTLVC